MSSLMPDAWDLAIVGAGAAGLPAAICAARRGARVLLIEAAAHVGGTMHLSSGSMSAGGVTRWKDEVRNDSAAAHYADGLRQSGGSAQLEILKLWTDAAGPTLDWLLENGVQFDAKQPTASGAHEPYSVPRVYTPLGLGLGYLRSLEPIVQGLVASGQIDLRLSTRMSGLLSDSAGAVQGVIATGADGIEVEFRAGNVVLATGGYENDDSLWKQLHDAPRRVCASPYSRGDGHRAATAVGAKLAYGEHYSPTYGASQDIDDLSRFWLHSRIAPTRRPTWELVVSARGERFMAEDTASPDAREHALRSQPDQSFWAVYDERVRTEAPPLFLWDEAKLKRAFAQSDNFQQAETLEALAASCGMDPGRLTQTVEAYNRGQRVGIDEFGRKHMPAPIGQAPFYAIRHFGASVVTWGGVVTDGELRVLGADGAPIPNLYAAGEILGMGVFGRSAMAGSMISCSLAFGRLLGERLGRRAEQSEGASHVD